MNTGRNPQEMATDYGASLPDGQEHMSLSQQRVFYWEQRARMLESALKDVLAAIDDGESVGSTDAVRRARELI